ncbi:MAG: endonuclease domain-containing protein [Acidimicrobiia bacterium]
MTSRARTLLDLGAVCRPAVVERALEGAVHRDLVTLAELDAMLRRVGARGRNGTGVLRELLERRSPGQAATESPLEDDLVRLLWHANLEPERQWVVALPDGRRLRLDLAFPGARVAVEVQGFIWHASRQDLQRDCDRHNLLRILGWQVLAFTAHDIRHRPGYTVETVWRAIRGASTTSNVV